MTEESLPQDEQRFEIQKKIQNLVGQQLDLGRTSLAEKLSQEESLQVLYELELERLKKEYQDFLLASQTRESELLTQLKEKDEKITANKEKLESLKISNEKIQSNNFALLQKTSIFEPSK